MIDIITAISEALLSEQPVYFNREWVIKHKRLSPITTTVAAEDYVPDESRYQDALAECCKRNLLHISKFQLSELNSLVAKSQYYASNIIIPTPVRWNDVWLYAKRADLPVPIRGHRGAISWGIRHMISSYRNSQGKVRDSHWKGLCSWLFLPESTPISTALTQLSQSISTAAMIVRPTKERGVCELCFYNDENRVLVLRVTMDTGMIITGWKEDERVHI